MDRTRFRSYTRLVVLSCAALLAAGVAASAATHGDEVLVVVTPIVVVLAAVALPEARALQVILGAVTAHFLVISAGWDMTEQRDFDIVVTIVAALAGLVGLPFRPWMSDDRGAEHPIGASAVHLSVGTAAGSDAAGGISQHHYSIHLGAEQSELLSVRQQLVVDLALQGLTARDIGVRLEISERTVESHLARAYARLGVHSKYELIQSLIRSNSN